VFAFRGGLLTALAMLLYTKKFSRREFVSTNVLNLLLIHQTLENMYILCIVLQSAQVMEYKLFVSSTVCYCRIIDVSMSAVRTACSLPI
jgi:hypothetical protein